MLSIILGNTGPVAPALSWRTALSECHAKIFSTKKSHPCEKIWWKNATPREKNLRKKCDPARKKFEGKMRPRAKKIGGKNATPREKFFSSKTIFSYIPQMAQINTDTQLIQSEAKLFTSESQIIWSFFCRKILADWSKLLQ